MTQANALLHKHTEASTQLLEVLQLTEVTLNVEHLLIIATLLTASFLHCVLVSLATLGLG